MSPKEGSSRIVIIETERVFVLEMTIMTRTTRYNCVYSIFPPFLIKISVYTDNLNAILFPFPSFFLVSRVFFTDVVTFRAFYSGVLALRVFYSGVPMPSSVPGFSATNLMISHILC